jgi:hypothetical protein
MPSSRSKSISRTRRTRRRYDVESLETRTLLSFAINYNGGNPIVTESGTTAESFTVIESGGLLEWSVNSTTGPFSALWPNAGDTVAASAATTVSISLSADGSSIVLGNPSSPASNNFAAFDVFAAAGNTTDTWTIDDSGSLTASTYNSNTGPGFVTGPGINLNQGLSAIPFAGGVTIDGSGADSIFNVVSTFNNEPVAINGGAGDDTANVESTGGASTGPVSIDLGAGGSNVVNVGNNPGTPSASVVNTIGSAVNVTDPLGLTALNILDAGDTTSGPASITDAQVSGLGFVANGLVNYTGGFLPGVNTLDVQGGTNGGSGIDYTVFNTSAITTLDCGPNADIVLVLGTGLGAPLTINGNSGLDTVDIGSVGDVSGILGDITVTNVFDFTNINVNAYSDTNSHDALLQVTNTSPVQSTLSGVAPANIIYNNNDVGTLSVTMGDAFPTSNNLTIDFSTGNPIPTEDVPGLVYNAGDGLANTLNLQGDLPSTLGGPGFLDEVHNANDPSVFPQNGQYGSITFTDQNSIFSELTYTGLTPINDTANATNYTFNDFADDEAFTVQNGPIVLGFQTMQFVNTPSVGPPTFETTNVANKTNIVFNTENALSGTTGIVNDAVQPTGLSTLTFNMPLEGQNEVSFINTPPNVATTLNGGQDTDTTNVTGMGIPSTGPLTLNGGPGQNVLNYDAGGLTPMVVAGPAPGEVQITDPGFGTVFAFNYQTINITGTGPLTITPGPASAINSVEGFNFVNAPVATFTAPITTPNSTFPVGLPASDFTSSITSWGDTTPASAGTITQDASNPSVYYITGTHTWADPGTFTVTSTVNFNGGTITGTVGGSTVSITYPPSLAPTANTDATATVTDGTLAVSAFPIVGTEGLPIAAAPIATFIDAGGADPAADYSATIAITNSTGFSVVIPAADTTITQVGTSAQFTVGAPAITLPEEGTYQVAVTVTDTGSPTAFSATGASVAVIADGALTAGAAVALTPNTGVALPASTVVGSFTDANPAAPVTDFTAVIDWGDGSANSLGTITQPGGAGTAFDVTGGHTYNRPGTYTITANVVDDGGARITLTGSATVTDLPVTGAVRNFTAVEGQNTGTIVLATYTDPNPLATVANETATLPANGWGDGTPTGVVTLAVQQIGATSAGAIFEVLGAHTYADEGSFTVNISVSTLGGGPTALTAGTATVHDATLTSSNGTELTGIEGNPTAATTLLGTFRDANQGATSADFTTNTSGAGSTVVSWGDGTSTALTAADVVATGSTDGIIFQITSGHTYAEAGTFAYTVTVTDLGGSTTIISGSAFIADAALTASATQPTVNTTEASIFPVPEFGKPVSLGPLATFTDGNPLAPVSDFTVTIDWGDGSPQSAGTVSQAGGVGTAFTISGSHTYADSGVNGGVGVYPLTVYIVDVDGSRLTIANTVNVADNAITLTGQLNPSSDSGLSNGVTNVTNVKQPDFFGTSEAYSHVRLFATSTVAGSTPVPIGTVQAGSDGLWNISSTVALADGTYNITATATDQFGVTMTPTPVTITSNLLIDTTGPTIDSVFFNRLNGEVDYVIQDPSPASGVNINSLLDSSNYEFTKVHANKAFPGKYIVTNITVTPGSSPNSEDVAVVFNNGAVIPGGFYLFTIRSSQSNPTLFVEDQAENALNGEFFGTFPSGVSGFHGNDFVAMLSGFHNKIFAPQTILGTASPGNGGAGGPPVGAVHSGNWTPVVPVGGGSVFGDPVYSKNHAVKKTKKETAKSHIVVKGQEVAKKPKLVTNSNHPKGHHHS